MVASPRQAGRQESRMVFARLVTIQPQPILDLELIPPSLNAPTCTHPCNCGLK